MADGIQCLQVQSDALWQGNTGYSYNMDKQPLEEVECEKD